MNFFQIQTYAGFWGGATAMISLHNTILSFFLFKARQSNVSNILKIVFNFSNFVRFTAVVGSYMTPDVATMLQCTSLQYLIQIGNFFVRVPLAAFLLWRLKQIHNNRTDNIVCITLIILRAGFGVVPLGFQRPKTVKLPDQGIVICYPNQTTNQIFTIAMIVVDILIDIYVTVRLYQILRKANKNAAQISSNMGNKSKRTLFTAVMYWNFLRLFVSLVFQLTPLLFYLVDDEVRTITLQSVINIILSYVITVDAEIVRVIEGRDDKKKGSSAGESDKSFKSMSPHSPRTGRPPNYSGYSPNDLPKYSPQDSTFIDKDKIVVSMKRLSFFEWANVVSGKRFRRNEDEIIEDEEEIEEIIEDDLEKGPSQNRDSGSTTDVEKGPSQNRDSTLSGSTSTTETSTTLDGNPDIIINNS